MASSSSVSRSSSARSGLLRCAGRCQADEEQHVRLDRAAPGQRPQNSQRLFELAGLDQCLGARNIGDGGG